MDDLLQRTLPSGITRDQIDRAVLWWGRSLEKPKFDNLGDRGGTFQEEMPSILATMTRAKSGPTEEQIAMFRMKLDELLSSDSVQAREAFQRGLHVDYDPDRILAVALDHAGIAPGLTSLPWKTNMWFRDGKVTVSHGYGAPIEEI